MKVSIATAPVSWGVFQPDGGASHTPYEVFLSQAHEAGYKAIELGPDGYLPQDDGLLRELLAKYDLKLCAGTSTISFATDSLDAFRAPIDAQCKRLNALGCGYMMVMDNPFATLGCMRAEGGLTPERLKKVIDGIVELDKYMLEKHGIRMVFHPHAATAIETDAQIAALMEAGDTAFCFDTGHHALINGGVTYGDQSAIEFIRKNHKRIPYLHFKNIDGAVKKQSIDEDWSVMQIFSSRIMCDVEDGMIDFKDVKKVLDEIDYVGYGVIEQDLPPGNATTEVAFAAAKKNIGYLKQLGFEG